MFIEFRVENHRSLRDEQVFTMEAGRVGDEADRRPRQVPGHNEKLLPVAVLYGANASGKSNVLAALDFMREAVLASHRIWSPDAGVPRDPFAWGSKKAEPSLYEVTLLVDDVRYQYGFTTSDDCFLEEWLHAWPHGKKQVWFERDGSSIKFGENLKGENKLIEEITRPNALFLSAAVQHKHQQVQPIYEWFREMRTVNMWTGHRSSYRPSTEYWLARVLEEDGADTRQLSLFSEGMDPLLGRFRELLRTSDVGIVNLRVSKSDSSESDELGPRSRIPRRIRFQLKHQNSCGDAWLPLEEESRGTQTLFRMALPVLSTLRTGGTLVVDELEASLHPLLAMQIVRQFNDPMSNPMNAQLVCTTHDTSLLGTTLGEPPLRRDQVWLTEKDGDGATVLYPLTDYQPRKVENLERGYLQGRYGAIPFLGDFLTNASNHVQSTSPS